MDCLPGFCSAIAKAMAAAPTADLTALERSDSPMQGFFRAVCIHVLGAAFGAISRGVPTEVDGGRLLGGKPLSLAMEACFEVQPKCCLRVEGASLHLLTFTYTLIQFFPVVHAIITSYL
ncbi:hypothetical protein F441_02634 [Phytophthora nicotianae CJ01A1]|nr:hypothetical protein F443_02672 [Phytophthora nicotianae P1569]ETK94392.1 hypothetical protein L915_02554 [Phytophthora nicotianae]ETO83291.1 hypothetical protein F444_02673 [Phytophthora nicotianae P1976]ETP24370.1 hypothetical protein F441_02634 [Phytophthora nicotianae CJ01A1]ETL47758.1 hypothetical protein L916_02527 [Phytophthora nicotianae]